MKKLIVILMMIMGTLTFAKEKLYMGTNGEYHPYEYYENGKLVGFDIELMEIIAKKLDVEIVWKDMSFDGLLAAIQSKKVDGVIAGMAANEARKKAVNFTIPYIKQGEGSGEVVIIAENSPMKTKEELVGKTLGAQLGTVQEQIGRDLGGEIQSFSNNAAALMAVQQGKLDGVVLSYKPAMGYLSTMEGLRILVNIGQEEPPKSAIAFHKENTEMVEKVNKIIEELKGTPEYDALYNKYLSK